jgi:hypothetical protein
MSTNMKTTNKDEIMRQILALLKQLVDDGSPKLPAVNLKEEGNALGGGWGKALIKAVSEKEIETKRGPATKLSLKLAWTHNGEATEVWASHRQRSSTRATASKCNWCKAVSFGTSWAFVRLARGLAEFPIGNYRSD